MAGISLRLTEKPIDKKVEERIINTHLSDIIDICSNPIRAGIIYVLLKSTETGHCMKVEELAYRLGTYHKIVIYHLERLNKWQLVHVKKRKSYGKKKKRSIWGLNLKYPNWIFEVYNTILENAFSKTRLEKLCSKNRSMRMPKNN